MRLVALLVIRCRVGTGVAPGAPHRPVREEFPHTVRQHLLSAGDQDGFPAPAHDTLLPTLKTHARSSVSAAGRSPATAPSIAASSAGASNSDDSATASTPVRCVHTP